MGKAVVTLAWEGHGPAHSGSAVIRASGGAFRVEDEVGTYGSFVTIDEASALDTFHSGGTPGPALTCSTEITASAALRSAALDLAGRPGAEAWINGARHIRTTEGDLLGR